MQKIWILWFWWSWKCLGLLELLSDQFISLWKIQRLLHAKIFFLFFFFFFKKNKNKKHFWLISSHLLCPDMMLTLSPLHFRRGGCPRVVMVKAMDCGIIVSKFKLQSHYYIHFQTNTLGKGMNPLILPAMG